MTDRLESRTVLSAEGTGRAARFPMATEGSAYPAARPTNPGTARRLRPLWLAVAVVLTFVGHDVLMAAGDQPRAVAGENSSHHAVGQSPVGVSTPAEPYLEGSIHTTHPDGCDTTRSANPPTRGDPDLGLVSASGSSVGLAVPIKWPVREWWREPTAPPGVRRALFQVFLM
jgi:hypothetical protein